MNPIHQNIDQIYSYRANIDSIEAISSNKQFSPTPITERKERYYDTLSVYTELNQTGIADGLGHATSYDRVNASSMAALNPTQSPLHITLADITGYQAYVNIQNQDLDQQNSTVNSKDSA
jgi:hypothetical protein